VAAAIGGFPEGLGVPVMGPNATGLGEIYQYYLRTEDGALTAMDLRALQDWTVRLLLRTAPGVDDVLSFGGESASTMCWSILRGSSSTA
jgi:cobalt-zinc-cadmium resistance protein CzcA